ncbi:glycosyl hydrolase family 76-domain-containing protein [Tricladium varicosporioides]|nr:glycosyl hydrolase family 76-domain-containing protein [Hymenoscyphus varicosporioides]
MRTLSSKSLSLLLLCISSIVKPVIGTPTQHAQKPLFIPDDYGQRPLPSKPHQPSLYPAFLNALDVLQDEYFATWQGTWPTAIDWTAAVIGTYISSALTTISRTSAHKESENLVNRYFSQLIASYFGQDAFGLRQEAYDDMLWVVLGWLESIKFIETHSSLHYEDETWYGTQWSSAFAHRARIFWNMASQGWDTSLCNGGMIWSPYLEPYKNAITNELYITASISMYLYFPGDDNTSPFSGTTAAPPGVPRDPKYLAAAIEGYKWLKGSNMTDSQGLYVDGYHVSGWTKNNTSGNKRCDSRNEMVYTYNQGVLLSGQRGLYEATGAKSYLDDGHQLVRDVIAATGWSLDTSSPVDADSGNNESLGKWHGLGRGGIMEEACDAPGYCSQDGQTFKGIFFHHLTLFCADLPDHLVLPGEDSTFHPILTRESLEETRKFHKKQCERYSHWIRHNAKAVLTTKDKVGKFGMWWGAPIGRRPGIGDGREIRVELPEMAVDYRNGGVPEDWEGKSKGVVAKLTRLEMCSCEIDVVRIVDGSVFVPEQYGLGLGTLDLNDRGRGRTVETQGGGVSVLRAAWEIGGGGL